MRSIFTPYLPVRVLAAFLLMSFGIAASGGWIAARAEIGSEELGAFDADLIDDSANSSRVWRAYSSVDESTNANNWSVSTMLSRSDDNGASYTKIGIINPAVEVSTDLTWQSEVPSLVFDPAADTSSSVKVLYQVLLHDKGEAKANHSWIAFRSAGTPEGPWSEEVKLIAGRAYYELVEYPDINGEDDPLYPLPADMEDCIVLTEPSTLQAQDGFYFGINCVNIFNNDRNRLLLLRFVHTASGTTEMQYKGVLLTRNDAALVKRKYTKQYPELQSMVEFGASDMATVNGITYLITSPVNSEGSYIGCAVFETTNLETASLKRERTTPVLLTYLPGDPSFHRGACSYAAQSTGSGIVLSQVVVVPGAEKPTFTLVHTGVQLPLSSGSGTGGGGGGGKGKK